MMGRLGRVASVLNFAEADRPSPRLRRLFALSFGLIYLCYPIFDLFTGQVTGTEAAWQAAALASFVAVYFATALSPRDFDRPSRWTAPLLGLGTVMVVVYPMIFGRSWIALPVYFAIIYAMALPPRKASAGIAGMAAAVLVTGLVKGTDGTTLSLLLLQVVTLGVLFMSVRRTRLLVNRLRDAQREVARLAANEERLRIARDLHDLLGHSLSLIVLKSELARRLGEQGSPKAAAEVADIESVARQALAQVREAVGGYRRLRLAEEIEGARSALTAAGVALAVRTRGTPLPEDLDGLFAWAVREAATNIARHSRATRCEIDLSYGAEGAVLEIADNGGCGRPYEPGNGLTGLGERVRAAGGDLTVEAGARGFRVLVAVPPPRPAEMTTGRLGE